VEGIPFFVVFPLLWVAVSWLLSVFGGWSDLGDRFRDEGPLAPGARYLQSARFNGFINYGSCLTAALSEQGQHLRVLLPYRLCHPPLLVPWSEISFQREQTLLFWTRYEFVLGGKVRVRLNGSLGAAVRDRVQARAVRPTLRQRRPALTNEAPRKKAGVDDPFEAFRAGKLAEATAEAVAADVAAAPRAGRAGERCPYCHDDITTRPAEECPHCGTLHHAECLREHGGCVVLACQGRQVRQQLSRRRTTR
jgi:hypothetical protein